MPLLDLVPPALALVLHHSGLFYEHARLRAEEVKERRLCASDRSIKLPAREDRCFAVPGPRFRTWSTRLFADAARACEPCVDGLKDFFTDRDFREREQQCGLDLRAGALRFRIEAADGLDLGIEEVNADGALVLR